jgi:transketolase
MTVSAHGLRQKSVHYRKRILQSIVHAGGGHTGGSLSCIDLLNVLYNRVLDVSPEHFDDPNRDRYVQSKGHSVEALYVVLADRGFFPESDLDTLCRFGSHYVGHPTRKVHGIEQNTGALGHGLSICAGMALAGKMDGAAYRVFTLLGDGELAEGTVWEASLFAAHRGLDNLVAIIDHNSLQITGRIAEVLSMEPLEEKFEALGWELRSADGHDVEVLSDLLSSVPFRAGKPSMLVANTVKGKGVSFMEDVKKWHHGVPDDDQFRRALSELDRELERLEEVAR